MAGQVAARLHLVGGCPLSLQALCARRLESRFRWRRARHRHLAAGVPAKSRGILYDDTSNTYLTMAEFDAALDVPGARIDLLAMDASLMGMLEVCYEIRDRAGVIVSSEESPPGPGYPYDRILRLLAANPEMTPEELGRAFVSEHVAAYDPIPVTQALIRTSRLPALAGAVNRFAEALARALPEHKPALDQARALTQSYAYPYYADLGDFAKKIRAYVPVPAAIDAAEGPRRSPGSREVRTFEAHCRLARRTRTASLSISPGRGSCSGWRPPLLPRFPRVEAAAGTVAHSARLSRRNSWAFSATITVLTDISRAPMAGAGRIPYPASTPAARGIATTL